jgi:FkbM family methyltransferase
MLPNARIYSFEPLPDCFAQLEARMNDNPKFVGFNLGLGNQSGDQVIERNNFSPSSSFLPMAEIHKSAFPFTKNTRDLHVKVERLDTLAPSLKLDAPMLVKIDVQGYEQFVLEGGEETIKRAKIVMIETSFALLYEGQALFQHLYQTLTSWGFEYLGAIDQLHDPKDGRPLQEDSLFIKPDTTA